MEENYIKSLCKKEKDNTMVLKIKIISWARENKVTEVLENGIVKIAIKAIREKGKANKELLSFLSKETGIKKQNISIVHWSVSEYKEILFTNT